MTRDKNVLSSLWDSIHFPGNRRTDIHHCAPSITLLRVCCQTRTCTEKARIYVKRYFIGKNLRFFSACALCVFLFHVYIRELDNFDESPRRLFAHGRILIALSQTYLYKYNYYCVTSGKTESGNVYRSRNSRKTRLFFTRKKHSCDLFDANWDLKFSCRNHAGRPALIDRSSRDFERLDFWL